MFLIPFSDKSPVNSGGQPCKKHELYVSFSDLGWKVSAQLQGNGLIGRIPPFVAFRHEITANIVW